MPDSNQATTIDLSICAVVVSFHPEIPRLLELCRRLESQCQYVIVDNGSDAADVAELRQNLTEHGHVIAMGENEGIAAAQNAGVSYATGQLQRTPRYLLFLDQDSLPSNDLLGELQREYESLKRIDPMVGAIGPALVDPRNQRLQGLHHETLGVYWKRKLHRNRLGKRYRVASVNSSGTFVEVATFNSIGGFREDFFIDHVDTEWSYRARSLGHHVYVTTNAVMEHEMGRGLENIWAFGDQSFPSRAPLRHYYLFRNNVYLLSQSQMTRTWKLWSIAKLIFTFCYFGTMSDDRKAQRTMMLSGIRDGRKGQLGKYSPADPT